LDQYRRKKNNGGVIKKESELEKTATDACYRGTQGNWEEVRAFSIGGEGKAVEQRGSLLREERDLSPGATSGGEKGKY